MRRKRSEFAEPKIRRNADGSRVWWYEWRAPTGEHRSLVIGSAGSGGLSKQSARLKLRAVFSAMEQAEREQAAAGFSGGSTVSDCAAMWIEEYGAGWRPQTRAAMRSAANKWILPAIGEKAVGDVIRRDVLAIENAIASAGRSRVTAEHVRSVLRGIWQMCAENGIAVNHVFGRRLPKSLKGRVQTAFLTDAEIAIVLGMPDWIGTACRVMLLLGLRPGEVLALRGNDIERGVLRIDEGVSIWSATTGPTKTGAVRMAPLTAEMEAELRAYVTTPDALLFAQPSGKRWTVDSLRDRVAEHFGTESFSLRRFRATCSQLLSADPSDSQALLGHSDLKMTLAHYRQADFERLSKAVADLARRVQARRIA